MIGIGPGYHHQIRILHSIVKEKCDSSMLFFHIEKGTDSIGEDLRLYSSMNYSDFVNTFNLFKDFIKIPPCMHHNLKYEPTYTHKKTN